MRNTNGTKNSWRLATTRAGAAARGSFRRARTRARRTRGPQSWTSESKRRSFASSSSRGEQFAAQHRRQQPRPWGVQLPWYARGGAHSRGERAARGRSGWMAWCDGDACDAPCRSASRDAALPRVSSRTAKIFSLWRLYYYREKALVRAGHSSRPSLSLHPLSASPSQVQKLPCHWHQPSALQPRRAALRSGSPPPHPRCPRPMPPQAAQRWHYAQRNAME